ncbi:MAG TPA: hypothetical protein VIP11_17185, partial [Gemmatimonadaceae bacterium]
AVHFKSTPPLRSLARVAADAPPPMSFPSTLAHVPDSIAGGLRISDSLGGQTFLCTLGIVADAGATRGFLTASLQGDRWLVDVE